MHDARQQPSQFLSGIIFRAAQLTRILRSYRLDLPLLAVSAWRALWPRRPAVSAPESPKAIAVVRLDAMGDLIMTTPIFEELRHRFPGARTVAIVQGRNRELLENNPFVDEVISPGQVHASRVLRQTRRGLALIQMYRRQLSGRGFDVVLQPRLDRDYYSSTVLLKLLNAPLTVRFQPERRDTGLAAAVERMASRGFRLVQRPPPQQESLSNLRIAEAVTGVAPTAVPRVFLTPAERESAEAWLREHFSGHPVVAASFGAQAERRIWPISRWAEALGQIVNASGAKVLLICSRAEQDDARRLASALPGGAELLAGAGLREVAALLERSQLFIGPDSGLAHLAAAVGTPPLVISPHPRSGDPAHENSPVRFLPIHPLAEVIQPERPTPPCRDGCDATQAHCILQISAGAVAEVALRKLATPVSPGAG